jgi:hypothetical protein
MSGRICISALGRVLALSLISLLIGTLCHGPGSRRGSRRETDAQSPHPLRADDGWPDTSGFLDGTAFYVQWGSAWIRP